MFSLADVTQIIENRDYAKKFLRMKVRSRIIKKIRRDAYTCMKIPFFLHCSESLLSTSIYRLSDHISFTVYLILFLFKNFNISPFLSMGTAITDFASLFPLTS